MVLDRPNFVPEKKLKTFGQMSSVQKYKIDHRFKALEKLKNFFNFLSSIL